MANTEFVIPTIDAKDLETLLRSLTNDAIPGAAALFDQAINGDPDTREEAIGALKSLYSEHPDKRPIILRTPTPRAVIVVEGGVVYTPQTARRRD